MATMENTKFTSVNIKEWDREDFAECSYEPIDGDDGELYQFYTFKNKKTGEKVVQIAKYVNGGNYIPLEEILPFFKNNEDAVKRLF